MKAEKLVDKKPITTLTWSIFYKVEEIMIECKS